MREGGGGVGHAICHPLTATTASTSVGFSTSVYGLYSTWASLVAFRVDCGMKSSLPPWKREGLVEVEDSDGEKVVSGGWGPRRTGSGLGCSCYYF